MSGAGFRIRTGVATHPGKVRRVNEDACLVRPDLGLWAVADGMGGHSAGDLASRTVVDSLAGIAMPTAGGSFIASVRASLAEANATLLAESTRRGDGAVIGSTVVALLSFRDFFACLWAGDSRLYRLREGVLAQLTRDHSQVQDMLEAGLISAGDAERHPMSNVITRAVGTAGELQLDKVTDRLVPQDLFLLCSDGLSKMIADEEIARILGGTTVEEAADALVEAALVAGGKDNVTVVTVGIGDPLV